MNFKELIAKAKEQIAELTKYIEENAGNADVSIDDLKAKETERAAVEVRLEFMEKELARKEAAEAQAEAATKAAVKSPAVPETEKGAAPAGPIAPVEIKADSGIVPIPVMASVAGPVNEKDAKIKAKATFYRAVLAGDMPAARKAYEGLGGIPAANADLGYGSNLLPINLSTELITEPIEENSLRQIEPVSQVSGLEEPVLNYEIEDADLASITDKQTAKEIELSGGKVTYGRFKTKVSATIKDTVLYLTDTDLVATVERALRSAIAINEKMNAFRTTADAERGHMSFYLNSIKTVEGPNLIQAIINAWSDLPDAFSERAAVVMRKQDYYNEITTLANGSDKLWGAKPEDVLGIKVIFNDRASKPVVGDFSFSRQNYEGSVVFETDKDAKKGEYYFVLTAWGDHKIRLKSAFRIAEVANP